MVNKLCNGVICYCMLLRHLGSYNVLNIKSGQYTSPGQFIGQGLVCNIKEGV